MILLYLNGFSQDSVTVHIDLIDRVYKEIQTLTAVNSNLGIRLNVADSLISAQQQSIVIRENIINSQTEQINLYQNNEQLYKKKQKRTKFKLIGGIVGAAAGGLLIGLSL